MGIRRAPLTTVARTPTDIALEGDAFRIGGTLPGAESLRFTDQLGVAAWVHAEDNRLEGLQALLSKWRPPDHWPGFAAFDATQTDGLPSRGYFGAVFDGRYVYFSPEQYGEAGYETHGVVLRLDTHGDFKNPRSFEAYDAGRADGLETRGFYGAAFDGRYVYFVPRQLGMVEYHSHLLRCDTRGPFKDPASWSACDIGIPCSHQSAAFDGRYLYLCPGFFGDPKTEADYSGLVVRCDTQGEFKDSASYQTIDISTFLHPQAKCFDGAAFDGRYIYLVPLYGGIAVRYDTHGDFSSSWEAFDARPLGYKLSVGAVFDGRYLYYCAYGHALIVRYDTTLPFAEATNWETFDADHTDGLRSTGFDGGFFDGRFVYFQPFFLHIGPGKRDNLFHSIYLRCDPNKPFADRSSWQAFDASKTDGLHSVGYNAGAFDGRYFYAAPWQQGRKPDHPDQFITHGIVLRCDTLGDHGTFSLRYCDYGHNGGLNAAAPGPSFLINTERGAFSAAAHRQLAPGRQHLAGTYDGQYIRLYIGGELAAQREAGGRLIDNDLPVVIGRIQDGQGGFRGKITRVRCASRAFTEAEIRTSAQQGDR